MLTLADLPEELARKLPRDPQLELIDNINRLLGDELKRALNPGARLKVAASCVDRLMDW